MIGIYKITNPKGRVYIGQSIDINSRFNSYKRYDCKGQSRLYESLKKYGYLKHKFEVLIECKKEELNELERYYQELYNVLSKSGLNCQYVKTADKKYVHSEETKNKISNSNKGKIGRKYVMSDEHKLKIGNANKGNKRPDFSKILSELNKNKTGTLNPFYQKKHSKKTKETISLKNKGKNKGENNHQSKKVLNVVNGIFYDSILEASFIYNYKQSCLSRMLNGKRKNNTNLILI